MSRWKTASTLYADRFYHISIENPERICYNEISWKKATSKGDEKSAEFEEEYIKMENNKPGTMRPVR